jgi:hypothetical protein
MLHLHLKPPFLFEFQGPETSPEWKIEEFEPGMHLVTFVPHEVGIYDIKALWNGRELPGKLLKCFLLLFDYQN